MKSAPLFLAALLLPTTASFAVDDPAILAAGDWSAPVTGAAERGTVRGAHQPVIRGRLLLCESPKNHSPAFYLELQDCGEVWGGVEIFCNLALGGACPLEARDPAGHPIPLNAFPFSGGAPGAHWVSLPADATVRLRLSPFATFTSPSPGEYSVSGTFTSAPPPDANDHRLDAWLGTLKLPALKIVPSKSK